MTAAKASATPVNSRGGARTKSNNNSHTVVEGSSGSIGRSIKQQQQQQQQSAMEKKRCGWGEGRKSNDNERVDCASYSNFRAQSTSPQCRLALYAFAYLRYCALLAKEFIGLTH
jgi:hypothetical protein